MITYIIREGSIKRVDLTVTTEKEGDISLGPNPEILCDLKIISIGLTGFNGSGLSFGVKFIKIYDESPVKLEELNTDMVYHIYLNRTNNGGMDIINQAVNGIVSKVTIGLVYKSRAQYPISLSLIQ